MKKLGKIVLSSILALSLLAPMSAYAHDGGKQAGKSAGKHSLKASTEAKKSGSAAKRAPHAHKKNDHKKGDHKKGTHKKGDHKKGDHKRGAGERGMDSIENATLFTLLAEKYSPDTLSTWESTIAEANKLRTEIAAIVKANPKLKASLKPAHTEDLKAKMEAEKSTREAFRAALAAKDAEKIKASLATILAKLQERNKVMANKLAELKKATTPATTTP